MVKNISKFGIELKMLIILDITMSFVMMVKVLVATRMLAYLAGRLTAFKQKSVTIIHFKKVHYLIETSIPTHAS